MEALREAEEYLASDVPVGRHLADQTHAPAGHRRPFRRRRRRVSHAAAFRPCHDALGNPAAVSGARSQGRARQPGRLHGANRIGRQEQCHSADWNGMNSVLHDPSPRATGRRRWALAASRGSRLADAASRRDAIVVAGGRAPANARATSPPGRCRWAWDCRDSRSCERSAARGRRPCRRSRRARGSANRVRIVSARATA